ncbi:GNAT family N-acetyltransferase [Labrys monachus]|uniref:N-acyltransferase n=1 Tax=Labrys monachus TaxID=217067 RepID=A0ABU0FHF9_9HYPH|nr:GNAT family N-acetyltransferase [Labrys monachus]MDQ0394044.1 putative N-acyltransferase [Labrys monachus]
MSDAGFTIKVAPSIEAVGAADWDACANPRRAAPRPKTPCRPAAHAENESEPAAPDPASELYNPFISYDFLHALEKSECIGGRSGWTPLHLVVTRMDGTVAGVMPAYGKTHSQGEYVFDWGWADAYERAGGQYYPKLQVSVPFTPATGRRFLVRAGEDREAVAAALVAGAKATLKSIGGSSIHATFIGHDDWQWLGSQGFLQRMDQQFHWINEGYAGFDDFLAALASRKRKTIKRERRDALGNGITIERLTGEAITAEAWDAFYSFYTDTGSRKWGRPYLNRRFYRLIGETMAQDVLLVMARRAGRFVAGAINFIGSDTLYGRNWGCIEDHPFLHFEVCYHQAIEFAIERGLARVEAGAQGEHKLARGYRPVTTYSAHYIADPRFRRAVDDYLAQEREQVAANHDALDEATPFKKG